MPIGLGVTTASSQKSRRQSGPSYWSGLSEPDSLLLPDMIGTLDSGEVGLRGEGVARGRRRCGGEGILATGGLGKTVATFDPTDFSDMGLEYGEYGPRDDRGRRRLYPWASSSTISSRFSCRALYFPDLVSSFLLPLASGFRNW